MITVEEMKKLEDDAEKQGTSRLQLMERAGHGVFEDMLDTLELDGKRIVVVCGHGNNGGDGFVLARFLHKEGFDVAVHFVGKQEKLARQAQYNYLQLMEQMPAIFTEGIGDPDIIVDAILGMGVKGMLREPYASLVTQINMSSAKKIAIDVPTGLDPDTGEVLGVLVDADIIYTFHDIKPGMQKFEYKTRVIDIVL